MYMAVAILKLKEEGRIDLDASMTKYLPAKFSRHVKDAEKVTVRMLLNHTSGIREYNEEPDFVSKVIMNPTKNFTSLECLEFRCTPRSERPFVFCPCENKQLPTRMIVKSCVFIS